jgi:hypothetical protein
VVPGTYTVKMTRGKDTFTTPLVLTMDPRAKYTAEDRKLNFDATMRVYKLLDDMTFDVDRINSVREALAERAAKLNPKDSFRKELDDLAAQTEDIRKKIVATKEGGAVTGEERIREKTTQLYGALVSYEGRPADYQVARIDSLKRELDEVMKEFDAFVVKEIKSANASLANKKLETIHPLTREEWDKANSESESSGAATPGGLRWRGRDFGANDMQSRERD